MKKHTYRQKRILPSNKINHNNIVIKQINLFQKQLQSSNNHNNNHNKNNKKYYLNLNHKKTLSIPIPSSISSTIHQNNYKINPNQNSFPQKNIYYNHNHYYIKRLSASNQQKTSTIIHPNQQSRKPNFVQHRNQNDKQLKNISMAIKQQKALVNKNHQIISKSKKVQQSLIKWRTIVQKNKKNQEQKKIQSARNLKKWYHKIQASLSRKSIKIQEIKSQMKQMTRKVDSKQYSRKKTQNLSQSKASKKSLSAYSNAFNNKTIHNPEEQSIKSSLSSRKSSFKHLRYNSNTIQKDNKILTSKHNLKSKDYLGVSSKSRVSTHQVSKKKKQIDQAQLQQSLFEKDQKMKRIRQARQIKRYLQQQKQNRIKIQSARMHEVLQDHRQQNRRISQLKKKSINEKFKQNRGRMRDVSLPLIHQQKMIQRQIYKLIKQQEKDIIEANQHNYQSLIDQKLKNMSYIMDKYVNH